MASSLMAGIKEFFFLTWNAFSQFIHTAHSLSSVNKASKNTYRIMSASTIQILVYQEIIRGGKVVERVIIMIH